MNHSSSLDFVLDSCSGSDSQLSQSSGNATFILPETVQFGYHETEHSKLMSLSENCLTAKKIEPSANYAHGVCYGAQALKGTVEFEVEITDYGTGWSGTMKLGVMRCKSGTNISEIPRYSPEGKNHCVWSSTKIHNRLIGSPVVQETEKPYGRVNLDDLAVGRRVGMRISYDGVLTFFVDGKSEGVAADNIYLRGYDVYPVVDHYANCKATHITRAVMRVDLNLEDLCIDLIASWLRSTADARTLPLPIRLIKRLEQCIDK